MMTKKKLVKAGLGRRRTLPVYIAALSGIALGTATTLPTYAQDNDQSDDQEIMEEVVVYGMKSGLVSSMEVKRTAEQFVDSIVAEDIGKLPDMSVAESLQRISGVQLERDNGGEASSIAIRGLTQVRTELNGRSSFTANSGRGLSFEDVPAELMAGVDVYKNPSAQMIEGGLGGTVDLRTHKPFNFDGQKLSGSVGVNYYDLIEDTGEVASGLYSNRWDLEGGGELGFLINLSFQNGAYRGDDVVTEPFWERNASEFGGVDGDTVYVPAGGGMGYYWGDRDRLGSAAVIQWAPSEDLEFFVQYLRSEYDTHQFTSSYFAFLPAADASSTNLNPYDLDEYVFNEEGVFRAGNFVDVNIDSNAQQYIRNSVTSDLSTGFDWQVSDQFNLSGDLQYVKANTDGSNFIMSLNTRAPVFDLDLRGNFPSMGVRPNLSAATTPEEIAAATAAADLTDPDNYKWNWLIPHEDESEGEQTAFRLDGKWDFTNNGFFTSFDAGLRVADREAVNKSLNYGNWSIIDAPNWTCTDWSTGAPLYPECNPDGLTPEDWSNQAFWGQTFTLDDPRFVYEGEILWNEHQFENLLRGETDVFGPTLTPSMGLVSNFTDEMIVFLTQNHPNPDYRLTGKFDYGPQQTNIQEELTQAVYGMFRFYGDWAIPMTGNIGVRIVKTDVTSTGVTNSCDGSGNCNLIPAVFESNYTNVLPSLNLKFDLTDELLLRVAASKGISRPGFDQMDPNITLNVTVDNGSGTPGEPDYVPPGISDFSATGGNPELEPMEVNQADVALEWYFTDSSYAYSTVFRKDVENFIAQGTIYREFEFYNPITDTNEIAEFESTVPLNGDDGTIEGFEIGISGFLDHLPGAWGGIGGQFNYTYVDSEAPSPFATDINGNPLLVPLEGLSRDSYNLIAMYEYGKISARLAYNWRDDYVITTAGTGTGNLPIYLQDYGQLDASFTWTINETFALRLDAVNLDSARRDKYQGTEDRHRSSGLFDRRVGLTLRAQM